MSTIHATILWLKTPKLLLLGKKVARKPNPLPRLGSFMESLGISTDDVWSLFLLIDADDNGVIDLDEFVSGCMQLHGPAKSLQVTLENQKRRDWAEMAFGWCKGYTPEKQHDIGKSTFSVANTSSNGGFSIVMLVFMGVPVLIGTDLGGQNFCKFSAISAIDFWS